MADKSTKPQPSPASPAPLSASPRQKPATGRLNSLGLSKRELDLFLDELEGAGAKTGDDRAGRRFVRRDFRLPRVPMQISQPGGQIATFPVACRNVSRTGVSLLHSAYIHAGTRCTLALPAAAGGSLTITGHVVRCTHRRGMVHEIGIAFDAPINLRELLDLDCIGDWFSLERVQPEELTGKLLYVEDCAVDRQLLRHHLKDTSLAVVTAEDPIAGLAKAATGFDIILCTYHMPVMDGPAFIEELRARSIRTPVLVLAHDADEPTRRRLARLSNIALLIKPVPHDLLLRAVAEFLVVSPDRQSTAEDTHALLTGDSMRELVADFLRDLPRLGDNLRHARAESDRESCRQVCLKIRGSARALGLSDLASVADIAISRLAAAAAVTDAAAELDRLLSTCSQPEGRPEARKAS